MELAAQVVARAADAGVMIATAESLTGGLVVARLVDVPGASRCVAGGATCYSLAAKTRLLGVDADLLEREGAVTAQVAREMARGALRAYTAGIAVATTGVAGPGPDERGVPAGTVHLAAVRADGGEVRELALRLAGDRAEVRERSVLAALQLLFDLLPATG